MTDQLQKEIINSTKEMHNLTEAGLYSIASIIYMIYSTSGSKKKFSKWCDKKIDLSPDEFVDF